MLLTDVNFWTKNIRPRKTRVLLASFWNLCEHSLSLYLLVKAAIHRNRRRVCSTSVSAPWPCFPAESLKEAPCRHMCLWQKCLFEQRHAFKWWAKLSSLSWWIWLFPPAKRKQLQPVPEKPSERILTFTKFTLSFQHAARADTCRCERNWKESRSSW